jgi:hypothetical protein
MTVARVVALSRTRPRLPTIIVPPTCSDSSAVTTPAAVGQPTGASRDSRPSKIGRYVAV